MIRRLRATPPLQLLKYLFSGGVVGFVNVTAMTLLVAVFGVNAQVSLAAAYGAAVTVHYLMQRHFVWANEHGYELHGMQQGLRYAMLAAVTYVANAISLLVFPGLLGVSELAVYFVTVATLGLLNFLIFRFWIFHPPSAAPEGEAAKGPAAPSRAPEPSRST